MTQIPLVQILVEHWQKEDTIPVGCVLPDWQPYVFMRPPLDARTVGGVGPEVNKFEQASSDDYLMSVAGGEGLGPQVWRWGGDRSPGLMSRKRDTLPCDLSHDACDITTTLSPCGQTDVCENITFPQLRLRAVINFYLFQHRRK